MGRNAPLLVERSAGELRLPQIALSRPMTKLRAGLFAEGGCVVLPPAAERGRALVSSLDRALPHLGTERGGTPLRPRWRRAHASATALGLYSDRLCPPIATATEASVLRPAEGAEHAEPLVVLRQRRHQALLSMLILPREAMSSRCRVSTSTYAAAALLFKSSLLRLRCRALNVRHDQVQSLTGVALYVYGSRCSGLCLHTRSLAPAAQELGADPRNAPVTLGGILTRFPSERRMIFHAYPFFLRADRQTVPG